MRKNLLCISFHICFGQTRCAHTCLPALPATMPGTTLHHNALNTVWSYGEVKHGLRLTWKLQSEERTHITWSLIHGVCAAASRIQTPPLQSWTVFGRMLLQPLSFPDHHLMLQLARRSILQASATSLNSNTELLCRNPALHTSKEGSDLLLYVGNKSYFLI